MSKRRRHRGPGAGDQGSGVAGGPKPTAHAEPVEARDSFIKPAVIIFLCALAVRLLHVWQIRSAPFFSLVYGDGASYDTWARAIAAGDWIGREVFYQAPLYPYFLGTIYTIFGRDLLIVRICQAVVGAIGCALLGAAGWRLVSRRVGLVAGILFAFSAPAIFSDAIIQKSVLDLFLICLLLWCVSGFVPDRFDRARWGTALGGLSLTRENALVLVAPLLSWLVWHDRVQGAGCGVQDPGCRVPGAGCRVQRPRPQATNTQGGVPSAGTRLGC